MAGTLNIRHRSSLGCCTPAALSLASFFFLVVPCARARVAGHGSSDFSVSPGSQFAITDFDGDSRPDLASVHIGQSDPRETRYSIDFQLTSGSSQTFDLTAPTGGLALASEDVNGDTYPDLVVVAYWTKQPVAILLNDGRGNFTRAEPAAFPRAFSVSEGVAIDRTLSFGDSAMDSRSFSSACYEKPGRVELPAKKVAHPVLTACPFILLTGRAAWLGRAPPL